VGGGRPTASACISTCSRGCRRWCATSAAFSAAAAAQRRDGLQMPAAWSRLNLRGDRTRLSTGSQTAASGEKPSHTCRACSPISACRDSRSGAAYSFACWLHPLIVCGYRLGILGFAASATATTRPADARIRAHAVPIGFAYVLAHYFSVLLWQPSDRLFSPPIRWATARTCLARALSDRLPGDLLRCHLVRAGRALISVPRSAWRSRTDRRVTMYDDPEEAVRQSILDARGDGRVHELWPVAAVGCGHLSEPARPDCAIASVRAMSARDRFRPARDLHAGAAGCAALWGRAPRVERDPRRRRARSTTDEPQYVIDHGGPHRRFPV